MPQAAQRVSATFAHLQKLRVNTTQEFLAKSENPISKRMLETRGYLEFDEFRHLYIYHSSCPMNFRILNSRGHWHRKNIYRVDFFAKAFSSGLTNYVIRHNSLYGNMSSLPWALCPCSPRSLASLANPLRWSLFKGYTLKVILNNIVSHQNHLSNAEL